MVFLWTSGHFLFPVHLFSFPWSINSELSWLPCKHKEVQHAMQGQRKNLHLLLNYYQTRNTRGQSYKFFYTFGQIYKPVLKLDNMLWLRKYLVRLLGCYTLKYSFSSFSLRGAISNLGTLFYTTLRLKKFYSIGPRVNASSHIAHSALVEANSGTKSNLLKQV